MKQLRVTELSAAIPTATTAYVFDCQHMICRSVQVVWGSTTASFGYTIDGSNDGTNYTNIVASQAISNDSGSTFKQIAGVAEYRYIRVNLTKTSGALTAWSVLVANETR